MASSLISLVQLIREFRALQAKDSVTPESLGYLLQRIVDLLATVGTEDFGAEILQLLENFQTKGTPVTGIRQGTSNANFVYTIIDYLDFYTGEASQSTSIIIPQASTTRAGAMTATQVSDLNTAKSNINNTILPKLQTLDTSINSLNSTIQTHTTQIQSHSTQIASHDTSIKTINSKNQTQDTQIQSHGTQLQNIDTTIEGLKKILGINILYPNTTDVYYKAQISCDIVNGVVHVRGASKLLKLGYVPYLFRHTRKRNEFKDRERKPTNKNPKYCPVSKGWHLYGSCHAVTIEGTTLKFSNNYHSYLSKEATSYSSSPSALVKIHTNKLGQQTVCWGRSSILLNRLRNYEDPTKMRMVKLRFAVGFAKKLFPSNTSITPADLVSSLAEFSIVFDPNDKKWNFSR